MTTPNRIAIDKADAATLRHFAETALGLEIKPGTNGPNILAKIKAVAPALNEVPELPPPPPVVTQPVPSPAAPALEIVDGEDPSKRPAAISRPASLALRRYQMDPKVELMVHKTSDKTRAAVVDLCVNGDAFRIKRGEKVSVPYRVYLALENAKENISVETDETNPFTGLPIREWQETHSYPFQVYKMPSDEEIAQWHAETDEGFKSQAA